MDRLGFAQYPGWQHSGSLFLLTTPDGANLPASAAVENFPVLVRLHKDFLDFSQAKANGEDIRFSSSSGKALPYEIEEWDAKRGVASIWVRVPKVKGNERQELKLHWGKPNAKSESNGPAVFNESNGYLAVLHMNEPLKDVLGSVEAKDVGTTATTGVVGPARHLAKGQGLSCGDKIANFPTGANSHSTEVWFRAEKTNSNIVAWGNEKAQGKVVMQLPSPPHVKMDCYFSGGNVQSGGVPVSEWAHIVHTYEKGDSRIYVNGVLDGNNKSADAPLALKSPAGMWIGGWSNNFDFVGDIDEVRISRVVRSADWVKLQYENQKTQSRLVGPVVQTGDEFSVSQTQVSVPEGQSISISAKAGGAQKVFWIVKRDGKESVVATDRFNYTLEAGRVVGDKSLSLQFKAIYPTEVKTKDVAVTIKEDIPEPVFTLQVPKNWNGRDTIRVIPKITNLTEMQAKGAGKLNYTWTTSDFAVTKKILPDRLALKRSQNSGDLKVTVAINNGGENVVRSTMISVKEPAEDAWVTRTPAKDEQPEDGQFYARDDKNEGTLHYNGTLTEKADSVFLKLYADDKLENSVSQNPAADKSYTLSIKLKPGLIKYKIEFGTKTGDKEKIVRTVANLICGDAYIIEGQSNAVSTDWGEGEDPKFRSPWIRTFGSMSGSPQGVRMWGPAVHRNKDGEKLQIGYWGMELGKRLVESQKIPICFINGAVGGTRIDLHQRNPESPTDMNTIYGRLLWRVQQAKLTHGIRGVLWHQGENDQGADGPTGGFGYENYRQYFIDMSAAWKEDYPNIQRYYVFQIWPNACSMGSNGSDNRLREVQRNLPTAFSKMSIMSTLGVQPDSGCHFPPAGYVEIAKLIYPLVERDSYGKVFKESITPPNLQRAFFSNDKRDEITMEFDQPVKWDNALVGQFYLDGQNGMIVSGTVSGKQMTLKLNAASTAHTLTYLDSKSWKPATVLRGENGIAALTFCEVPLVSEKGSR